ncbi:MAG: carotenoid biosynthesis protein [Caldisericia bacterium]|nr:carotenoid biosynthesis protein [Caldisericia bacterium]
MKLILRIIILFFIPLIYEYIGINYGGPLRVRYYYSHSFKPQILGLPIFVWIFWAIFILISYYLSSLILINILKLDYNAFIKDKLNFILISLFDGFIVTTFDLFIDPIAIKYGLWRWENFKFSYFGVPIGNFVGWFIIATSTSFLLRILDYFMPTKLNLKILKFIPIIYLFIIFILSLSSTFLLDIELSLMSLLVSSPVNILSIYSIRIYLSKKYL